MSKWTNILRSARHILSQKNVMSRPLISIPLGHLLSWKIRVGGTKERFVLLSGTRSVLLSGTYDFTLNAVSPRSNSYLTNITWRVNGWLTFPRPTSTRSGRKSASRWLRGSLDPKWPGLRKGIVLALLGVYWATGISYYNKPKFEFSYWLIFGNN